MNLLSCLHVACVCLPVIAPPTGSTASYRLVLCPPCHTHIRTQGRLYHHGSSPCVSLGLHPHARDMTRICTYPTITNQDWSLFHGRRTYSKPSLVITTTGAPVGLVDPVRCLSCSENPEVVLRIHSQNNSGDAWSLTLEFWPYKPHLEEDAAVTASDSRSV